MGGREAQKADTRARVLAAARDLFEEVGYDETTVRAIARRAGVSVGSVFTGFSCKADVLGQVMAERLAELYAEIERVAPHLRGSTADRCRSLFALFYAFELRRLRLFLAFLASAFDWRAGGAGSGFGANKRLRAMVRGCLADGIARGEVRADADLDLIIDVLVAAYAWNYRTAAGDDGDVARLTALMDRQIGLVFEGLGPRA
ncbi:MAG TPA: TetR/AcrR family transcriptional regulator [Caulobacteraceae bacterium]|nr:TetR/AcrR family transcriptional regulator [Caulobacteraceae bacterium]